MADFIVRVVLNPAGAVTGSRRVRRELQGVENAADRVRRSLAGAFAFVGIGVGVRGLIDLADAFTNVQNRLRTVTDGQAELARITNELFEVSNRTRQSFEATAELYARVGLASRELGLSQRQTLQFTESLNQAVTLSGATAAEAEAGLIQLSQGLASGALQGDELRSVLEQLPVVADVIADSLGVTRGQLRGLGADGMITADVVIRAFAEAREELAGRFAETVPTIGQAFAVLRNNVIQIVGAFTQATGASDLLAQSILILANNMETILRLTLAVGLAMGVQFARVGIGAAIAGVTALTAAIAANPIGAIAVGITIAVSALVSFADRLRISGDGLANLQDLAQAAFEFISTGVAELVNFFRDNFGDIFTVVDGVFDDIGVTFESVLTIAARVVDGVIGVFLGGAMAVVAAFQSVPAALEAIFTSAFNAISAQFTGFINNIISGLNLIPGVAIDSFEAIQLEAGTSFSEIGSNVSDAFAEGFAGNNSAENAVNALFDRAEAIAQSRIADQRLIELANARLGIDDAPTVPGTPPGTPPGTGGGASAINQTNEALERQADLLREITGDREGLQQRAADLRDLFARGAIDANLLTEAMRTLNVEVTALDNTVSGGIANGLARIAQESNNLGQQVSDFIVGAFDQATESVVNFARTGEFSVNQFFGNLADQLLRLAANQVFQQLADGPLFGNTGGTAGGGGIFGGILSGLGGLLGFQNGGNFTVGGSGGTDSQLVAFRATPGEDVSIRTPGQQRMAEGGGGGGNSQTIVNFNITTPDVDGFRRSQSQLAAQAVRVINRGGRNL